MQTNNSMVTNNITDMDEDFPDPSGRAWIEVNLNNLHHNVSVLHSILPESCKIMAVIKSNAYGHGDATIAKELNKLDIDSFAVATLAEGVTLRKNGIRGDILIFGYTHPNDFKYLVKYQLTQTCFDYEFANNLNQYGEKIKVHIKIDTGMHRLGEYSCNLYNLEKIYRMDNLEVDGIYTHLCVSDSKKASDIQYTRSQIEKFNTTIAALRKKGINPGKLHVQSSYGVLNYSDCSYDYARIGIVLFGALSKEDNKLKSEIRIKPVLSIKARVVITKKIKKGDTVSYGRKYTAPDDRNTAVISIGYADGISRSLSGGHVIIHGKKAPIIGRICMDQLIVDITDIPDVKQNDLVTVLGKEGNEEITAEEIAGKSCTIANEVLSRLGYRLTRIYIN